MAEETAWTGEADVIDERSDHSDEVDECHDNDRINENNTLVGDGIAD